MGWDAGWAWYRRHETREISRKGRQEVERSRAERAMREEDAGRARREKEVGRAAADLNLWLIKPPTSLINEPASQPNSEGGIAVDSQSITTTLAKLDPAEQIRSGKAAPEKEVQDATLTDYKPKSQVPRRV